jgi:hypothetical protein
MVIMMEGGAEKEATCARTPLVAKFACLCVMRPRALGACLPGSAGPPACIPGQLLVRVLVLAPTPRCGIDTLPAVTPSFNAPQLLHPRPSPS